MDNIVFEVVGAKRLYLSPRLGKINLSKPFTNNQALRWYKDKNFPYIRPVSGAEQLLASEDEETLKFLLNKAKTKQEINILLKATQQKEKSKKENTVLETSNTKTKK